MILKTNSEIASITNCKTTMVVGLTGGIGSGKTTVLKMFQALGVSCYVADLEAKILMNTSEDIKKEIGIEFGEQAYTSEGLNREYLAKIVFGNKEKLKKLNNIVHPRVRQHFIEFVKKSTSSYVIYESAIIFENKDENRYDYIITVTAPVADRIQRVLTRDATTETEILSRMKHQLPDEEKITKSDFVIYNSNIQDTTTKVEEIHKMISTIAS